MKFKIFQRWPTWNRIYTIRILNTFFREFTTQSNTAFSFGTRLMVFSGLNTRNTRRDFMVLRFWPVELPLKQGFFLTNLIIKRYGTGKVQGFVISFPILCLVNIKWNLIYNWTIINLGITRLTSQKSDIWCFKLAKCTVNAYALFNYPNSKKNILKSNSLISFGRLK